MLILSPAKINLHLRIGKVRTDGFHPLVSWFCTTGLADEIAFQTLQTPAIELTCDRPDVPVDDSNLIVKAATLLRESVGRSDLGVRIHLTKRIPMGGGLGGGSSNAATTLMALNSLWSCGLSHEQLHRLAAKLGSDVPFFLNAPSAICRGRGELVQPVAAPRPRWMVLITPGIHMPTPAVYRRFDQMGLGADLTDEPGWSAWAQLPAMDLLRLLVNDLEPPAFAISNPLSELRQTIESQLNRPVRMSGSGSTLFTLFDDQAEAHHAAQVIQQTCKIDVHVASLAG